MNKYSTSIRKTFVKSELIDIFRIRDLINPTMENVSSILSDFGFDLDSIDFGSSQITLRINDEYKQADQMINVTHYDSSDNITEKFMKIPLDKSLISFEGEIYENLDFKSSEEVEEFIAKNGYERYIDMDTKAVIHFRAREVNPKKMRIAQKIEEETLKKKTVLTDREKEILEQEKQRAIDVKDIYITKDKNLYTVFYEAPYYYNNKKQISSFTCEEIDTIIERILPLDSGYFILYVQSALLDHKKTISNRGFVPTINFIDSSSLRLIENNIVYPNEKEKVSVKIKVISDQEVKFKDLEQTKRLVLK